MIKYFFELSGVRQTRFYYLPREYYDEARYMGTRKQTKWMRFVLVVSCQIARMSRHMTHHAAHVTVFGEYVYINASTPNCGYRFDKLRVRRKRIEFELS